MAELPTMPLYTDALLSDAGDLPNALFGAYVRLLCRWWREGANPEKNEKRLARWAGLSSADFEDLKEFLTETENGWIQKKLHETFSAQREKSEKARASANARWGNANAQETKSESNADGMLSMNHEPTCRSSSATTSKKNKKTKKKSASASAPQETITLVFPEDEEARRRAEHLVMICTKPKCASYFQPFPRKAANGKWQVFAGSAWREDRIDSQFHSRLDAAYGENQWEFAREAA